MNNGVESVFYTIHPAFSGILESFMQSLEASLVRLPDTRYQLRLPVTGLSFITHNSYFLFLISYLLNPSSNNKHSKEPFILQSETTQQFNHSTIQQFISSSSSSLSADHNADEVSGKLYR